MKNALNISPWRGIIRSWIIGGLFLIFSVPNADAFWGKKACGLKLRQVLSPSSGTGYSRKKNPVDQRELERQSGLHRKAVDADSALTVTKGSNLRTPEQVEASLNSIINKIKSIKNGTDAPLKIEEFFGLIDGHMGRHGARMADLFRSLGVTKVSLLSKSKFDYHIKNNSQTKTDEVVLDLSRFPTDSPEAAAIWIKDLNVTLHTVAMQLLKRKQESLSRSDWQFEYSRNWKKKVRDMRSGMSTLLKELNSYLQHKFPSDKNPLSLPASSLPSPYLYHGASIARLTDVFMGGTLGATVGHLIHPTLGAPLGALAGAIGGVVSGYFVKIQAPIGTRRLSLADLGTKEGIAIEEEKLRLRTSKYYYYKYSNTGYANYVRILALSALGYTVHSLISHGSFVTSANDGLDEESKNVEKLEELSDSQIAAQGIDKLKGSYNFLLTESEKIEQKVIELRSKGKIKESERAANLLIQYSKQMSRILVQLKALSPDGLEE